MYNLVDLTDKKILITGASSGIGRSIAELLDKLGAQVILVARREDKLQEVQNLLSNKNACYYAADLSVLDKIEDLIKLIVSEQGVLDGFVHSAGITSTRPLKMIKPSVLNEVMTINFYSFVEICRCISLKKRYSEMGCNIVGISSISSIQGNKSKTAYAASKGAMDAAVRCMAKELSDKNFRVNSVAPALIETELYDKFSNYSQGSSDAEMVMARQYLGLGRPVDVANMVAFLLSDASRFITGSTIGVDGGRLTW
ncbi:MAG: SDR family oxidoreductase [Lachnospiraceae bacterium]|nr:SDR family oxidoreductase [Lachnospiraceae bacterium]